MALLETRGWRTGRLTLGKAFVLGPRVMALEIQEKCTCQPGYPAEPRHSQAWGLEGSWGSTETSLFL